MLTTYAGTGKIFFVGNWEGDWELMWSSGCKTSSGYDFNCVPTTEKIDRYIAWSDVRKRAIDDAKRHVMAADVDMFLYIEFNLATENFDPNPEDPTELRPTILNSVVPHVNPDYLSYSSYKSTNTYRYHTEPLFDQDAADQAFW